jgi:hypothetical protein
LLPLLLLLLLLTQKDESRSFISEKKATVTADKRVEEEQMEVGEGTSLDALEVSCALPIRDELVVCGLLTAVEMGVVLHHVFAERI